MAIVLSVAILAAGCLPRTVVPLRTLEYDLAPGNSKLVVFLPGRGEHIERIKDRGLFETISSRGYDVIVTDLHLAYYMEGSFLRRLSEDVIEPARQKGYRDIWLVGNSLGGNGAMFYLREHPEDIDGVILLGPYLGNTDLINEILSVGGMKEWRPGELAANDHDRALWDWIRRGFHDSPPIFLCYGTDDRFAMSQELLASMLPPERIVKVKGGHDWVSWKKAWDILFPSTPSSLYPPLP